MFYDRLKELCKLKGVGVTKLIKDLGLSNSNLTRWKNGATPKTDILNKISEYLGISIDDLLGTASTQDDELNEYLEFLKYRPEGKMLFSVAKNCTKEEVEQAVKIIDAIRSDTGVVG